MLEKHTTHAISIDSTHWTDMLMDGAGQLGMGITVEQATQFARHATLLLAWNRKINLTAITDPVQMAVKHYLDSVAPLAHIPNAGELLDLGTGGGFPGIPLKILRPNQPMTLIDGTRKKINFVKQAIRQIGLTKIEALHQRAEILGEQEYYKARFKVIVSRAVADIEEMARLAGPMLAEDGVIVVYKGPGEALPDILRIDAKPGQTRAFVFQVRSTVYKLPLFSDKRRVVLLESIS